ncbi:MAG: ABC transporter ATP-binding protein [Bacteroidales bacterium]|nr:ABC transporter ATP-binding protein [Bacteroidales bacterium]MBS3773929.1 ABC transporter ATP-binding protein [Bacteroidales bacterium]
MAKKILELDSVAAGYNGKVVIRDVDMEVYDDDFIGVIGPNGGGKTTLLKVILGILKPLAGKVRYYSLQDKGNMKRMGYLPQLNMIDRKFPISAMEVVLSGLMPKNGLLKKYSRKDKQMASQMMDQMGISHLKHKAIGELSGGQMQRVYLCRAIISSPKLLILDEPNTFVDNKFEGELYEHLRELNKQMAIILVSHDIGTITPYVKTIACVNLEFHYHRSNVISEKQLAAYNCPIQLITHGDLPHTVLKKHNK